MTPDQIFLASLNEHADTMSGLLSDFLSVKVLDGEVSRPARLMMAMRHGALNGGKRIRPWLVTETAALFGLSGPDILRVAASLECIHCYSLVHDDLPAMDDDDLRRGLPTVHKAFDEATAILAGDSLLTIAFDILASPETGLPPAITMELVSRMARAAGPGGMAGGQALDLAAATDRPGEEGIITLQAMKTGALIRYACEAGAIAAGASAQDVERLGSFGSAIGLAFQLADDLLDVTADAAALGKATGKDEAAGKATLVAIHGADWARNQLAGLVDEARDLLAPYGEKADRLSAAAGFIANRTH